MRQSGAGGAVTGRGRGVVAGDRCDLASQGVGGAGAADEAVDVVDVAGEADGAGVQRAGQLIAIPGVHGHATALPLAP